MTQFARMSQEIVERLCLSHAPVGVTLYTDENAVPKQMSFASDDLKSYCQALVLAGKGQSLLLKKEQMGCKLGTSVLGFEAPSDMEGYLDDGVLEKYGVGLFGTEAASADTIMNSFYLEKGRTAAAYIAPMSQHRTRPQVVVFTANSQQVMWLLYALNYDRGGKMDLPQSGGALGGCADITALPILNGQPNITFLGLGCRLKSAIDACDLMVGVAGDDFERIHGHILEMARPISMLTGSR